MTNKPFSHTDLIKGNFIIFELLIPSLYCFISNKIWLEILLYSCSISVKLTFSSLCSFAVLIKLKYRKWNKENVPRPFWGLIINFSETVSLK